MSDGKAMVIDVRVMRWAWVLGLGGLLPFVAQAIAAGFLAPPHDGLAVASQIHYAALILAFVGGVHWGVVLVTGDLLDRRQIAVRLVWGVAPSLYAFGFMQLAHPAPLLWLAGGLLVAFVVDWFLYAPLPGLDLSRFRPVRVVLTTGATLSLLLTWWFVQPG